MFVYESFCLYIHVMGATGVFGIEVSLQTPALPLACLIRLDAFAGIINKDPRRLVPYSTYILLALDPRSGGSHLPEPMPCGRFRMF